MSKNIFYFKQFKILQENSAMKVGVDSVLFGACISFNSPNTILDVGTGTGLLSFMARQRSGAKITGLEIDEGSYLECVKNIELNNKQQEIEVHHISFQDFAFQSKSRFDHIISNPPWFNNSYQSPTGSRNFARQNKTLSMPDLLAGTQLLLAEKGIISVIIPFENEDVFIEEAKKRDLFCFNRILIRPNKNKSFHRIILECSRKGIEPKTRELCIRNYQTNQYSEEYIRLTKDFYLDKLSE